MAKENGIVNNFAVKHSEWGYLTQSNGWSDRANGVQLFDSTKKAAKIAKPLKCDVVEMTVSPESIVFDYVKFEEEEKKRKDVLK